MPTFSKTTEGLTRALWEEREQRAAAALNAQDYQQISIDGMSDLASRLLRRLRDKPITGLEMRKEFSVSHEELAIALDELRDKGFISQRPLSEHN